MKKLFVLFILTMSSHTSANTADLKPCPDKPNCVSSMANDDHAVAPFQLKKGHRFNSLQLIKTLKQLDNNISVIHDEHRIHAEITSRVFGFVDDLDLIINTKQHVMHVRSASRTGYYDFGVNRRRVEKLRALLISNGII